MDLKWLPIKIRDLVKQYRFVFIIFAIGLLMMILPEKRDSTPVVKAESIRDDTPDTLQQSLERVLCQLSGAGRVCVLLTEASGEEIVYQTNEAGSVPNTSGSIRRDTVTVTNSLREQTGLIRQVNPPKYMGAIILCQGADIASVKLAITEAVSSVTGLTYDKISVLRIK